MAHYGIWGNGYGRYEDDFDYSSLRRDHEESEQPSARETSAETLSGIDKITMAILGFRPQDFEQPAPSKEKAE